MSKKEFSFGQPLRPEPEPDNVRDVYDALFGLPWARQGRNLGGEQPLFRLAEMLRRLDDIDERRLSESADSNGLKLLSDGGADADNDDISPPVFQLTPERFVKLRTLVVRAYADVRDGCSADRIIADEMLNDEFLRRCWELGALATPYELNWHLLNARKAGRLRVPGLTKRFRIPTDRLNEFTFATEFAIRRIQDLAASEGDRLVSLDRILCDPRLAKDFDDLAKRIAPGYASLEYRWAAFTIRKSRRPYQLPFSASFEHLGCTRAMRVRTLPDVGGIYRFNSAGRELYIGETDNIRRQIEIHFDNNGTGIFPDWLDPQLGQRIDLFIAPMRGNPSTTERSRAKTSCTDAFRPNFNWLGAA